MAKDMLAIRHLTKRFGGRTVLDDVSLDVAAGETVALLGPNGAGKTTLLRVAAGCLAPTGGRVTVDGADVLGEGPATRGRLGYLPENCPLFEDLTVAEHLRFRGRLKGLGGRHLRRRIREVAEAFAIEAHLRTLTGFLSLGLRRRVGLADAWLHEPALLILDDPFAGLDPLQTERMRGTIAQQAGRAAVLLATHRLAEVEALGARVALLDGGCLGPSLPEAGEAGADRDTVRVEVSGGNGVDAQQIVASLPGASGVMAERLPDGWWSIRCDLASDAVSRGAVADALVHAGWRLRLLEKTSPRLRGWFGERSAPKADPHRTRPAEGPP
jgi:ABC-2 type transport system ATP-binding protein